MDQAQKRHLILWGLIVSLFCATANAKNANVQTTYLWHLQQPIYWPAPVPDNKITYQKAYDSIIWQSKQGGHPESNLGDIFGKDDRVAVYQYRAANAIDSCANFADMGAQVSYSGCLIENINSLANNNWNGGAYQRGWNSTYANERKKTTSGGFPKLDLVSFTYHHALAPLIDKNSLQKEIEIHKIIYSKTWGTSSYSNGFFPAEMAFSERMIPTLVKQGIKWVIVPNNHISRSCKDYPYSPSGDNNNPPNQADQVNPSQSNYFKLSISRGCTPNNAYPFSYRPHYAQYIDPESGQDYKIIVVPAAMAMSWEDGYSCYGTQDIDKISSTNDPNHPMLIVLAHDGDNDFGGGYSYYMQCVQQFVQESNSKGYHATTIDQYLSDFPVDPNDIVHVEDGAWVNADGDFGAPRFINWNWPLTGNGTQPDYDIENGWQLNERNWAVITAAQNVVEQAEQMSGGVRLDQIQSPTSSSSPAELAWHFFLPSLTSGYMYYGNILDMQIKQTVACNQAVSYATKAIKSLSSSVNDKTPPSIWYVMRQPYNPGGYGMGSLWKYKYTKMKTDFHVYTFVYDYSGISNVTIHIRTDNDNINPIHDHVNELYNPSSFGLSGVSDWKNYTMVRRQFPKGNEQGVTFEILPTIISDEYYYHIDGYKDILIDYYISATDTFGNIKNTDIYHVYIGNDNN